MIRKHSLCYLNKNTNTKMMHIRQVCSALTKKISISQGVRSGDEGGEAAAALQKDQSARQEGQKPMSSEWNRLSVKEGEMFYTKRDDGIILFKLDGIVECPLDKGFAVWYEIVFHFSAPPRVNVFIFFLRVLSRITSHSGTHIIPTWARNECELFTEWFPCCTKAEVLGTPLSEVDRTVRVNLSVLFFHMEILMHLRGTK